MPDYAAYVWGAYGVAALAMAGLVLRAVLDARAQSRALRRLSAVPGEASADA